MSHRQEQITPPWRGPRRLGVLLCLLAVHCVPAGSPSAPVAKPTTPAAVAGSGEQRDPAGDASPNATGAAPAPMADPQFNFEALLARERGALPLAPVMDPKGRWRGSIEARQAPLVVDRGDHVSIRTTLATKDELRCEVHAGQLNPGASIANLLGAASGTIALEHAAVYRVGSAGGAPVLFASARYQTRQTPPLGGELKLAISPGAQYSFICVHDEPGYHEAFARIVEGLVASFESATPTRAPQYSTLWQFQVGEAKTGYSWERIYVEADGSVSSFNFDVMLAQLASGELRIRDYMAAEIHDRSGIRRANYLSYRGITKAYEIELERSDAGPYQYRGTSDGKPIEGRLSPRAALGSEYEVLLRLLRSRDSKGPLAFSQEEYRPRLNATELRSVDYSLDATGTTLKLVAGGSTDSVSLEHGLPNGSRVISGPNTFVGSVIHRHNALGSEPGVTLGTQPVPNPATPLPLAERRRNFTTQIFAETTHTPAPPAPVGVLSKVTYPASLGNNVAYVTPLRPGAKRPAIVWIGGGLDWKIDEVAWAKASRDSDRSARALREAGLVVMLPALRGSNENPGRNECFLGEVDDLIAAGNFLRTRADVDPTRLYLAGHASGGTLALLAAASSERFAAVFAFGPVSDARQYGTASGGGCLPADATAEEVELRAPVNFVGSIRTPTFVFEGGLGGNADVFDDLRERASANVHFAVVPGLNSTSILAPGTEAIARAIMAGRIDDASLVIAASRPSGAKAASPRQ